MVVYINVHGNFFVLFQVLSVGYFFWFCVFYALVHFIQKRVSLLDCFILFPPFGVLSGTCLKAPKNL